MRIKFVFIIGLFLWCNLEGYGQTSKKDSAIFLPFLDFSYGLMMPGGDMANRFGLTSEIGIAGYIKTKKNLLFGLDWNYLIGNDVREVSFADAFRDSQGGIMGNNGLYSEVIFSQRGFTMSGKFGAILPLLSANANSGVMIIGGIGFIQHRIKIEDKFKEVPLLSGEGYYPGYDRLSNGMMFTEFVGYRFLSDRRLINIFGGFEFSQGLTKNRREINFDTGVKDTNSRLDILMGIRLGFSLLLYKPTPESYYYN